MKVTVNSKKGLKIDLKVFIDKKIMNVHMSEKYEELKKTVALKGFRPGKVPTEILKKQFGKAIYGEVLDKVLKETSAKALEEQKIKVAGQPKIDLKTFGEEKDLEYTIQVEELPKVGIEQINNIKLINYEVKVSDKDIQKRIAEIAKNQNNFKDKKDDEKSQNGDLIVFDYKATVDDQNFEGGEGKNTQIILGKDLFIKNFDKHLLGVKKKQEVTAEVILPENYPNKKYSNKKAKFFCKILNVKKPEITQINDEFAKNLGAKDLNDLKILVSKQVHNQYKQTLDLITKNEILNQLDKFKEIEIPKNLINQEVEILSQGMSNEEKEKNKLAYEYYKRFDNVFTGPGKVKSGKVEPLPRKQNLEELTENLLICPVNEMIDKLSVYAEAGVDEIIISAGFGQNQNEMIESMHRISEEVIPYFKKFNTQVA